MWQDTEGLPQQYCSQVWQMHSRLVEAPSNTDSQNILPVVTGKTHTGESPAPSDQTALVSNNAEEKHRKPRELLTSPSRQVGAAERRSHPGKVNTKS